jgi:hypothetical protein
VPDTSSSARFAGIWSILHEGGLVIDTPVADHPEAPLALRTVLQLDGDRTVIVDLGAMAHMSQYERLRLAVRHGRDVRAKSAALFAGLHRGALLLRGCLLIGFGGTEMYSFATRIAQWQQFDWRGLLREQIPCLLLLAGHKLLPYGTRLLHVGTRRLLSRERRRVSGEAYTRMTGQSP